MTNKRAAGFTLIELTLAMAFIAFLLLFITSAIMQLTRLYAKGLAIRQINQVSRQVVSSVSGLVRYNQPIYLQTEHRLCVGGVSYVWNPEGDVRNKFDTDPNLAATQLRFVSVNDSSAYLCGGPILPDVVKSRANDLIGPEITALQFDITQYEDLYSIKLVLSTVGDNLPNISGGNVECAPDNQFCAFGDFETSVYSRRY